MDKTYSRPPILEAILAFSFATPIDPLKIRKNTRKYKRFYSNVLDERETIYEFQTNGESSQRTTEVGSRFISENGTEILILRDTQLILSELAPYQGWEQYKARAQRDWQIFRGLFGHQIISRIGLRYINRIDIPGQITQVSDYFTSYPIFSFRTSEKMKAFQTTIQGFSLDENLRYSISTATSVPVIPEMESLILDIDVYKDTNIPLRDDEKWGLVDYMRRQKNEFFEAIITDRVRELIR